MLAETTTRTTEPQTDDVVDPVLGTIEKQSTIHNDTETMTEGSSKTVNLTSFIGGKLGC
jgi:hypothetical protein